MYQDSKETPVAGLLGPEIKEPRFKRVADAIRRGCKAYPKQAFWAMFVYKPMAACALGAAEPMAACALAAAEAGGVSRGDNIYRDLVRCPVHGTARLLCDVIISLNDRRRMTREHIADWLETLE